jgi:cyclic nucleotide-binding protein
MCPLGPLPVTWFAGSWPGPGSSAAWPLSQAGALDSQVYSGELVIAMASEGGPAEALGEAGAAAGGHAPAADPPELRLTGEQVDLLRREGEVRPVAAGQVLFQEGDRGYDFIVILAGRVAIVDHQAGTERELATGGAGDFVAELNLLTGERLFTTAVVTEPGAVLAVPVARLYAVIGQDQGLGQWIIRAMFARGQWLSGCRRDCGSPDSYISYLEEVHGPTIMALRLADEQGRRAELRAGLRELYSRANTATKGTLAFEQEYLLVTAAAPAAGLIGRRVVGRQESSRDADSAAAPSRAWRSSWPRDRTASWQDVLARMAACSLLYGVRRAGSKIAPGPASAMPVNSATDRALPTGTSSVLRLASTRCSCESANAGRIVRSPASTTAVPPPARSSSPSGSPDTAAISGPRTPTLR